MAPGGIPIPKVCRGNTHWTGYLGAWARSDTLGQSRICNWSGAGGRKRVRQSDQRLWSNRRCRRSNARCAHLFFFFFSGTATWRDVASQTSTSCPGSGIGETGHESLTQVHWWRMSTFRALSRRSERRVRPRKVDALARGLLAHGGSQLDVRRDGEALSRVWRTMTKSVTVRLEMNLTAVRRYR